MRRTSAGLIVEGLFLQYTIDTGEGGSFLLRLKTGTYFFVDAYWYIEAVPELLQLATQRLMASRQEDAR